MNEAALQYIREHTGLVPELAIILGSGLGPLADEITSATVLPYSDIPGFQDSTAPGHAGELHLGHLGGRPVVAMKGRMHFYDGISASQQAFPVRVMHGLGATKLLVSNACGGLDPAWNAGELMLQLDFINMTGANPLIGPWFEGERFPVMFDAYDPAYIELARRRARQLDMTLREGVYLAISGPTYNTRAELRAWRTMGADVVGMSTVFEVMMARQLGMRVLGLSCITDMAIADRDGHATGDQVVAAAMAAGEGFRALVRSLVPDL